MESRLQEIAIGRLIINQFSIIFLESVMSELGLAFGEHSSLAAELPSIVKINCSCHPKHFFSGRTFIQVYNIYLIEDEYFMSKSCSLCQFKKKKSLFNVLSCVQILHYLQI